MTFSIDLLKTAAWIFVISSSIGVVYSFYRAYIAWADWKRYENLPTMPWLIQEGFVQISLTNPHWVDRLDRVGHDVSVDTWVDSPWEVVLRSERDGVWLSHENGEKPFLLSHSFLKRAGQDV